MGGALGAAFGTLLAGIATGSAGFYFAWRYAPIAYPRRETLLIFAVLPVALATVFALRAADVPTLAATTLKLALLIAFPGICLWLPGLW